MDKQLHFPDKAADHRFDTALVTDDAEATGWKNPFSMLSYFPVLESYIAHNTSQFNIHLILSICDI